MLQGFFKSLLGVILLSSVVLVMGCAQENSSEEKSPHTGNEKFEEEKAPKEDQPQADEDQSELQESTELKQVTSSFTQKNIFRTVPNIDDKTYYVYTNRLNVRSTPEIADNIVGQLGLNDEVKVLAHVEGTVFVQIQILKTSAKIETAAAYYVSKEHLSDKKEMNEDKQSREKFFIIQNVASERMRVYEKLCAAGSCAHKLVFETEIVVGEKSKSEETMTVLGHLTIQKWQKFYQDGGANYPSWYDPSYPSMPKPGSSVFAWRSNKVMPHGQGQARGAFGWYTAIVGPNPYNQWTHGTVGWGSDKRKFIKQTRGFWANLFGDPRSHGCSRTDNESIAYLRHLVNSGSEVFKVYAKEGYGDPSLSRYAEKEKTWDYILTKNGVRVDGEKPDRSEVLARGTPSSQWLEEGTYTVDLEPSARKFKPGSSGAESGKSANVYGLDNGDMNGVFLVDEGRLVSYSHPSRLKVGGYKGRSLPEYVTGSSGLTYTLGDKD